MIHNRLTFLVALVVTCLACQVLPEASSFSEGMDRAEIIDRFSVPDERRTLIKQDEAIWGAIEDFWSSVPVGASVEIWLYGVEGGTVELYFIDASQTVNGVGFAPEGAVFEADS